MEKKHIVKLKNPELNREFNIYQETGTSEFLVANENGVSLFRAESEALARYGIRTSHHRNYSGMMLTEKGIFKRGVLATINKRK